MQRALQIRESLPQVGRKLRIFEVVEVFDIGGREAVFDRTVAD
jgi:hypothetical protein